MPKHTDAAVMTVDDWAQRNDIEAARTQQYADMTQEHSVERVQVIHQVGAGKEDAGGTAGSPGAAATAAAAAAAAEPPVSRENKSRNNGASSEVAPPPKSAGTTAATAAAAAPGY